MRASRFRAGDSLDLLLDTMCNTFGGIILIAILVALLARESPSPIVPADRARSEMIERRLAMAEVDLAAARTLKEKLESAATPTMAERANERQRLADALQVAQKSADEESTHAAQAAAVKSTDPGQILADLAAKAVALERRASDLQNAIAAQTQNGERLRARLAELAQQIEKEFDTRTKQLRLPKERAKTKAPFNVILKFGRAYPLTDSRGERNVKSIEWNDRFGSHRARPMVGAGDDAASVARLFQALTREEFYVAFYVYPDAFGTFAAVREAAASAGLDYGLEIVRAGTELSFGSDGTSPPPL